MRNQSTLIQNIRIIDSQSPFNQLYKDIIINEGIITKIAEPNTLQTENHTVLDGNNLCISPGWVDMQVQLSDPGFPNRDSVEIISQSAAKGGFTNIICFPNTLPTIDKPEILQSLILKTKHLATQFHFTAALTIKTKGEQMTELASLLQSGAVAFTDGIQTLQSDPLLLQCLQYLNPFGAITIQLPNWQPITQEGVANESATITALGLKTISPLNETLLIARDIQLAKYANTKIHFTSVSTKNAVELIAKAQSEGIFVTADTAPPYLFFDDSNLNTFDTNFKTFPPLRSQEDIEALQQAVRQGVITCFGSAHCPLAQHEKEMEFDEAAFGILSLETAFAVLYTQLVDNKIISLNQLIDNLTHNPRKLLNIKPIIINKNQPAILTLFNPTEKWTVKPLDYASLCKNTPYIGKNLTGKVHSIFTT